MYSPGKANHVLRICNKAMAHQRTRIDIAPGPENVPFSARDTDCRARRDCRTLRDARLPAPGVRYDAAYAKISVVPIPDGFLGDRPFPDLPAPPSSDGTFPTRARPKIAQDARHDSADGLGHGCRRAPSGLLQRPLVRIHRPLLGLNIGSRLGWPLPS